MCKGSEKANCNLKVLFLVLQNNYNMVFFIFCLVATCRHPAAQMHVLCRASGSVVLMQMVLPVTLFTNLFSCIQMGYLVASQGIIEFGN